MNFKQYLMLFGLHLIPAEAAFYEWFWSNVCLYVNMADWYVIANLTADIQMRLRYLALNR